jgi:nucleotide-binding universal stress UspA family protein
MLAKRRILSPTDFSHFSERALAYAVALADRRETVLTLLHVVPPTIPPTPALPFPLTPQLEARARQAALDSLARFAKPARLAGIETELEVREGSIAGHIVKLADVLSADLVVMGTHGAGGSEGDRLGSVAEEVLSRVRCPMLTVPRALREHGTARPGRLETILCPLDFADPTARALRIAASLAREKGARLLLLHVLEGWAEDDYEGRARLASALGPEDRAALRTEEMLAAGKPYLEILRLATERAADLVVMGVHGRRRTDLWRLGSSAQHVVRGAICPVLTVRSGAGWPRKTEVRDLASVGTRISAPTHREASILDELHRRAQRLAFPVQGVPQPRGVLLRRPLQAETPDAIR